MVAGGIGGKPRHRHCPKCQSSARDRRLIKQARSLLPVPYVHVVFIVPEQLVPLALRNQRLFYNLLFRAGDRAPDGELYGKRFHRTAA
jgi:hypothetical protein